MIYTDQLNKTLEISQPPKRIISLIPSITELLFDLGLEGQLIGITRFCIFPARARKVKTIVGGTKNLKLHKIRELKPDLIIADKEENTKEQIQELAKELPVWTSNIQSFDDAIDMISQIGALTNTSKTAKKLTRDILSAFAKIPPHPTKPIVAYFIWQNPLMVAADDTFINEMLKKVGFINAFQQKTRYPQITPTDLYEKQPDFIFLSSEPFPFSNKHLDSFRKISPKSKIILVDGTYFSWYGSRMKPAANYLQKLHQRLLKEKTVDF